MGTDGITSSDKPISSRHSVRTALVGAVVLAVAWGAFAFGAVYPWAYASLAVVSAIIGVSSLIVTREGRPPLLNLASGLLAIGLAIAVQLVPLPEQGVALLSPKVLDFQAQYDRSFGLLRPVEIEGSSDAALKAAHPLSIETSQTLKGLLLFGSMALLFLGVSRLLSATGSLMLARPVIVVGIVLALVGIGQDALTRHEPKPLIYGFWKPQFESRAFGPFVNPNHFAGWMLMVLPLALALAYEALQRTLESSAQRGSKLSMSNIPAFGRALTFGFCTVAMALALIMTRSRSGLAAFGVGSVVAGWMVLRRQRSNTGRAVVVLLFLALLGGASAWAGLDNIVTKAMGDRSGNSLGGRIGAWHDTLDIVRDFPLTGSGFNTYGRAMTIYQTGNRTVHFQEAHNDYLQLAAEGGLLLGIPVVLTIGIFVRDVRRRFREAPQEGTTYWLRVGALIGLVSIAMQSVVEFSLQMPGNAALFAVLAAIAVHQSPNLRMSSAAGSRSDSALNSSQISIRHSRHAEEDH